MINATGKLLFTFIAGISQFERDMIHERTIEGLNAARKRGRLGGRPKIPKVDVEAAFKMYDSKSFTLNTTVTPKKSGLPK